MYSWSLFVLAILLLVLSSISREGFICSVEKCRKDQSFIKRDDLYCCFDPIGEKENILSTHMDYNECYVDPGKHEMTLYDSYGKSTVYDTPVSYNCNAYNVLVNKK